MKILEDFLEEFDAENRSSQNKAYLDPSILEKLPKSSNALVAEFVSVYTTKKNYKMLRTITPVDKMNAKESSSTWDIIRNRQLAKIKCDEGKLFNSSGSPTDSHLEMIYWAYSPQPSKVKAYYDVDNKSATKRQSSGDTESPTKKKRTSD